MIDTQHDECMCVRQLERKVARLERSEYEYKRFVWMLVTTAGGHVTITDELMNDYNPDVHGVKSGVKNLCRYLETCSTGGKK